MVKKIVLLFSFFVLFLFLTQCESSVKFTGKSKIELTGKIFKPEGNGPFPAVVMMHGCGGAGFAYDAWAELLQKAGFVAFVLDSFKTRGVVSVCSKKGLSPTFKERIPDAYDAQEYLASLPFVDAAKISLIGWSHGGVTALMLSVKSEEWAIPGSKPFYKVIAFYPYCFELKTEYALNNPVLVLIGQKDDWTPANLCESFDAKMKAKNQNFELKVYPDSTHAFDFEGVNAVVHGHVIRYNETASKDAQQRVIEYLRKN